MNLKQAAKLLNGRQYLQETTVEEENLFAELGFVAVFGYSDDSSVLTGAINENICCCGSHMIPIHEFIKQGVAKNSSDIVKLDSKYINAVWVGNTEYSWTYETNIVHETFDIMEDQYKFCKGIIFDINNMEES